MKRRATSTEWRRIGALLKTARDDLAEALVLVDNNICRSAANKLRRLLDRVDNARSGLEEIMFASGGPRDTHVFYPARKPREDHWDRLVAAEPRLEELLADCQAVDGSDEHFCANRVWCRDFKPRLVELVGWDREGHPELESHEAYDVAYDTCYHALPDCRDCTCIPVERPPRRER